MKKLQYEDSFVKVSGLLGGEEYVKVARALLNNENATDEEIASATGLKINVVRRVLYDLFGKSLITGIRVKDPKRGWYVYQWRAQTDQVDAFLSNKKRKILGRLKQRLDYETSRRGQLRPVMPPQPPEPTAGAKLRAAVADAYAGLSTGT